MSVPLKAKRKDRVHWKEVLKREPKQVSYNQRYHLRKRAQRCIDDLSFILKNIEKVAKKPEKEFYKIFARKKKYFNLINTLHKAFRKSYSSKVRLAAEENSEYLRLALMDAGVNFKDEDMYDNEKRIKLAEKILQLKREDGLDYWEWIRIQIFRERIYPEIIGVKQHTSWCGKCGGSNFKLDVSCRRCGQVEYSETFKVDNI